MRIRGSVGPSASARPHLRGSGAARAAVLAVVLGLALASCSSGEGEDLLFADPGDDPTVVEGSPSPGASDEATPGTPSQDPGTPGTPGDDGGTHTAPDAALAANICSAAGLWGAEADRIQGTSTTKILYVLRTTTEGGCGLEGYPEVTFLDAAGAPIAVQTTKDGFGLPAGTPRRIAMTPDTSLSFFLAIPAAETAAASCASSAAVRVALAGTGGTLDIPSVVGVCAGVGVSPVQLFTADAQLGD